MSIKQGKLSNYTGQSKENRKLNDHLVAVDRDVQNIWIQVNTLLKLKGINSADLATDSTLGFSYMPTMVSPPQGTPVLYSGQTAFMFCKSDSSLRIYNSSDSSWKTVVLT